MSPQTLSTAFLILCSLVLYQLALIFAPFFTPILWALILAQLFFPVYKTLLQFLRGQRTLSAGLSTIVVTVMAIMPVAYLSFLAAGGCARHIAHRSGTRHRSRVDLLVAGCAIPCVSWFDERPLIIVAIRRHGLSVDARCRISILDGCAVEDDRHDPRGGRPRWAHGQCPATDFSWLRSGFTRALSLLCLRRWSDVLWVYRIILGAGSFGDRYCGLQDLL